MAAMQPVITDVNVSWILPDAYDVIYTPEKLPSVFLGERLNLYAILASKETGADTGGGEKAVESVNSVKEFWFEDTDLFEDDFDKKQHQQQREQGHNGSHLSLSNTSNHQQDLSAHSPAKPSQHQQPPQVNKEESVDYDSEVFLTEEEVRHLSNEISFQKRSSIDRVQKWKVSKFPENNDMDSDFEDEWNHQQQQHHNHKLDKETQQNNSSLSHHSMFRKKNGSDGNESVGSSNSFGSNLSSSSHYYPFPGFPTRMSSCRSIEARSPHVPKLNEDIFSFQQQDQQLNSNSNKHSSKVSGSQVNLSDYSSDQHSSNSGVGHHSRHKESHNHHHHHHNPRPLARLTEALYAEKANTHLIDESNETTFEHMLENLVSEKRAKLQHWLREQEEMTQCLWPATSTANEYEKRDSAEKHSVWRDSGIGGNRSSSDAHTSDIDDETHAAPAYVSNNNNTSRKKMYSGSDGSSSSNHNYHHYHQHQQQTFEKNKTSSGSRKESKGRLSREETSFYQQQQQEASLEKSSRKESIKDKLSRTNSATSKRKNSQQQQQQQQQQPPSPQPQQQQQQPQQHQNTKTKAKLSNKTSNSSNGSQFQRRKSKARSMWNAIIDKMRTVGAIVTEKSGEATFKSSSFDLTRNDIIDNNSKDGGESGKETEKLSSILNTNYNYYNSHEHVYEGIANFKQNDSSTSINTTTNNNKSEPPSVRPKSQGGYYNNHPRNRPIIENSRTISTASMFEIGKSEIGDVENLHLLPSQALIYLSGQCGEHAFKRIIPFQLEVNGPVSGGGETINTDTTIHQLAAKSIIHDLELQMENDDGMLEDHGKIYIR